MAVENALLLENQATNSNQIGKVSLFLFLDSRYILSCFVIVCVTVILANSFLLVVIWKDPKKCLRTRSAFLTSHLIIAIDELISSAHLPFASIFGNLLIYCIARIFVNSFSNFCWASTSNNTTVKVQNSCNKSSGCLCCFNILDKLRSNSRYIILGHSRKKSCLPSGIGT